MTRVSGYWLYIAPCCSAQYRMPTYRSACLNGKQVWSDGYWYGDLWTPRRELNLCRCGKCFLTSEADKSGPHDDDEVGISIPFFPEVTDEEVFRRVEARESLGTPKQECAWRRYYWQILNHRQRCVGTYSRRGLPGDMNPGKEIPPWYRLPEADTKNRVQENLEALLPLMLVYHQDEQAIIGDIMRMLGRKNDSIKYYGLDSRLSDTVKSYLVEMAVNDARRLVRILPADWIKEMPDRKEVIQAMRMPFPQLITTDYFSEK